LAVPPKSDGLASAAKTPGTLVGFQFGLNGSTGAGASSVDPTSPSPLSDGGGGVGGGGVFTRSRISQPVWSFWALGGAASAPAGRQATAMSTAMSIGVRRGTGCM
jgi:hypothetical protein